MSIKVVISPALYPYTNNQQVAEVNGSTVGQCLNHLVKKFPELKLFDKEGKLFDLFGIYVNGESTYPEGLEKLVKDGDELDILFIIGGG